MKHNYVIDFNFCELLIGFVYRFFFFFCHWCVFRWIFQDYFSQTSWNLASFARFAVLLCTFCTGLHFIVRKQPMISSLTSNVEMIGQVVHLLNLQRCFETILIRDQLLGKVLALSAFVFLCNLLTAGMIECSHLLPGWLTGVWPVSVVLLYSVVYKTVGILCLYKEWLLN